MTSRSVGTWGLAPSPALRARILGICGLVLSSGCTVPGLPSGPLSAPEDCSSVSELFLADDVLNDPDHACRAWVDRVHGRVAKSGFASAAVWTRLTDRGTGLMTSAVHTLGVGFLGPEAVDLSESLRDPAEEEGVARIRLFESDGVALDDRVSPMFMLYSPEIPTVENANGFRNILPVHDFYVAVLDSQKLMVDPAETPAPVGGEGPAIYDPLGDTTTLPTIGEVSADDLVLVVGFPSASGFGGALAVSVGMVLDDSEAKAVVAALGAVGDEEGDIAYAPVVEMFIEGSAAGGMSGGGVFDEDGRLVGIIVRTTEASELPQYVRAVRLTYVVSTLAAAFDGLEESARETVRPFLEVEP